MQEPLTELRELLSLLGDRERRLLLLRAGLQGFAALLLALVAAGAMLSFGLGRAPVAGLVGALGGLGLWVALAWPLLRRWSAAGSYRRQAALLEANAPELRSRLLTVIEQGEAPSGSPVLLARAAARAVALSAKVPPDRVHSSRPARRAGLGSLGALLLALCAGFLLPVGPMDAVAALWSGSTAAARLADAAPPDKDERALVGDIVLRYVFPDYTGLAPLEIPNSDGTIHAPPGTVVSISARTAVAFEAAALQVDEAPPVDATLRAGRDISGSLTVGGDGVWRFLLFRGQTAMQSADYRIVVEADAPPVVTLQGPNAVEVAADDGLSLGWQASDDYGLDRVAIEVTREGTTTEFALRDPLETPLTLAGALGRSPRELGLKPGDDAILRVVAWDNDKLGGSKKGVSQEIKLSVLGPRGQGKRIERYYESLVDAMLPVLADFLEEPSPPASSAADIWAWAEKARPRFDAIRELVEAQWQGEAPTSLDGYLVERVLSTAARLFRFTQTAFDPATDPRPSARDLETLASLHEEEIAALEQAIYALDTVLRQVSLADVAQQAQTIAEEAAELKELLAGNATAAELQSRLDQLSRLLARMSEAAARLSDGQLREFLNARDQEAKSLIDEIRKAIAEGRMDEAAAMMDRLADMLQELSEGLGDQLAESQESDDEMAQRLEALKKDLSALEKDQRDLADQLKSARQQEGGAAADVVEAWSRLDPLAERVVVLACDAATQPGDGSAWRAGAVRKLSENCKGAEDLQAAIRARDPNGATARLTDASLRHRLAINDVNNEARRARPSTEAVPAGIAVASRELVEQAQIMEQIREILDKLRQQNVSMSPALEQLSKRLGEQQQRIAGRQQALSEEVRRVEQAMPTGDGSAGRAMQTAGESMLRAKEALQQGDPMGGEGHQRYGADQVAATRRALEREENEMKQMQQAASQMSGEGKGQQGEQKSHGNQDGQSSERAQIEIPAPENFRTPEAYREALLEGMEGDVPDEYRALKQRYYEELVRQ